ncbi:MAG: transcription antitermination factor NusB [Lentisphaeria bacterium]|nr:transcription antitermination factor NusB [Lentisphaeria bacterium]
MTSDIPKSVHRGEAFQQKKRFCRAAVVQLLYQMDLNQDWELTDQTFSLFWEQLEASGKTPAFGGKPRDVKKDLRKLLRLVLEHRPTVDEKLAAANEAWPLERMTVIDRNILRLGMTEILFSEKTPRKVAINEAIELARAYGDKESPAFVNGMLDQF